MSDDSGARVTETVIRVRSTDVDSQGIMNNARYFEYFEQARLDHLVAIGLFGAETRADRSRSFTLAETTCRYRASTRHRDDLHVRAWTEEVGNRSFKLRYEMVREGDGAVVAEGSSAQVWLDENARPTPLDGPSREKLVNSLARPAGEEATGSV